MVDMHHQSVTLDGWVSTSQVNVIHTFIHSSRRRSRIRIFGHQVIDASWGYMPLTQPEITRDLLS
jgi:hypothetical protein